MDRVANKLIWCIDCGEEVEINERDGQTCRCDKCQGKIDRFNKSMRNKKYYETHKN